jgi:hypothetical protein
MACITISIPEELLIASNEYTQRQNITLDELIENLLGVPSAVVCKAVKIFFF